MVSQSAEAESSATAPNARRRVLVVDDEPVIANTLAQILNQSGFEATAVYSGNIAMDTAREFQPDVLISDVIMRGVTGIETAIQISKIVPACRIILFSGQAATGDLLKRAEAQGHHFEILAKPLHPQTLLNHLKERH